MTKAIVTYITTMVIIFALTCTVSANSDCELVSQDEIDAITAIQAEIDRTGGGWIAGKTTVSGFSAAEKNALGRAKIASLPPGATVVRPASTGMSATSVSATGVSASTFDWRDNDGENWVTPVRSQGSCGSCWAFSAIGAVESAVLIYTDNPDMNIDLSEQHLVSSCCSAGSCSGGWPDWALDYVRDTGVPDEDCFPYIAGNCGCDPCSDWTDRVWNIEGYVYVQPTKEDFKAALQQYGPMSVVLTVPSDWYYYRTGVYSPTQSREDGVGWANHAVVLVGWDDSDDCWIIKNSWGQGWGENGYARVKYGDLEQYNYAYAVTGVVTTNEPPEASTSATPLDGDAPLATTFAGTGT
ncbi:MAG: C1 family peptidase, partial [Methanosarcinales archaeon]|nr:C1 family peptidase [Methanosarcinales archaeon]